MNPHSPPHLNSSSDSSPPGHLQLERAFGPWTGIFVVISSMVGAGILTSSGYTLRDTGNPAALFLLWTIGGLMALCGAFCIAEMSTALPRTGGDYIFVREAFGPGAGAVAGWATFLLGFAAPTAVVARLAADYTLAALTFFVENPFAEQIETVKSVFASSLILVIGVVHCLGQRESSFLQGATTLAKFCTLAGLALMGIFFGKCDWAYFQASHWPAEREWGFLSSGLIYVSYAYIGWNGAAYIAGEIKNPAKNLPIALVCGCFLVTVLYLIMNLFYVLALNPADMPDRSIEEVGPIAELATRSSLGPTVAGWVSAIMGLGLVASVSAFLLTGPRVAVAMAHDLVFPSFAAKLHTQWKTPVAATLCQVVLSVCFCWSGSFLDILDYTSVGLTTVSAMVISSIFVIRRRKDLTPSFRVPLHPLPAIVMIGLSAWTVISVSMLPDKRLPSLLSLATIALGIPIAWWILPAASRKPLA